MSVQTSLPNNENQQEILKSSIHLQLSEKSKIITDGEVDVSKIT